VDSAAIHWHWRRFGELGAEGLYDWLALRCAVFVLEQGPYLDPDGLDRHAWHLLGREAGGGLVAGLRALDPGRRYAEPSIGRVVVAKPWRGTGLGRTLFAEGLARTLAAWPGQGVRLSAQAHLERFYGSFGFERVGEPYLEDDIPHVQMLRPLGVMTGAAVGER
jgi:ElaA protein